MGPGLLGKSIKICSYGLQVRISQSRGLPIRIVSRAILDDAKNFAIPEWSRTDAWSMSTEPSATSYKRIKYLLFASGEDFSISRFTD